MPGPSCTLARINVWNVEDSMRFETVKRQKGVCTSNTLCACFYGTDPSNSDTATAVCVCVGGGGGGMCTRSHRCVRTRVRACVRPCVRDVFAIYINNIRPRLIMIIIKNIILYFIQIRHTDDFPSTVPG